MKKIQAYNSFFSGKRRTTAISTQTYEVNQMLESNQYLGTIRIIVIAVPLLLGSTPITLSLVFATIGSSIQGNGGNQPNIDASVLNDAHSMVLGDNIKNLVIFIPNEAHESTNQPKDQLPLANQPYLPQNAVVNRGTTVTWFNGDVDHDHTITQSVGGESTSTGFESGDFAFNTPSRPITFNDTGRFNYVEADVNDNDPSFVMNGTIDVINQANLLTGTNATAGSPDTVGTLMVPAQNLDQYVSTLASKGFTIDSTHTFKDLRGGQKGTGPDQTYIVWTTSGLNLDQVLSALEEISPSLPYS